MREFFYVSICKDVPASELPTQAAMLNAIDVVVERGSVDVHVLSKADLLKLGRNAIQLLIKNLTSEDLQKYCAALAIPHNSDPSCCESMKVAILEAIPNERVSLDALLSDGVSALKERLRDATLAHPSTNHAHTLLREQEPGLLQDCAKALDVRFQSKGLRKNTEQLGVTSWKLWRRTAKYTAAKVQRLKYLQSLPKDPQNKRIIQKSGQRTLATR